jgi:hypothetical protein
MTAPAPLNSVSLQDRQKSRVIPVRRRGNHYSERYVFNPFRTLVCAGIPIIKS